MTFAPILFGIVLGIQRGLAPSSLSHYLRRTAQGFHGRRGGFTSFFAPAIPDAMICLLLGILLAATSFCYGIPVLLAGLILLRRGTRDARFRKGADHLRRKGATHPFPWRSPRSFSQAALNDLASPRLYLDSLLTAGPLYMAFPAIVSFTGNLIWFLAVYLTTISVVRYSLANFRFHFRIRPTTKENCVNEESRGQDFRHFDMPDYLFSLILIIMGIYFLILGSWTLLVGPAT